MIDADGSQRMDLGRLLGTMVEMRHGMIVGIPCPLPLGTGECWFAACTLEGCYGAVVHEAKSPIEAAVRDAVKTEHKEKP